MGHSSYLREDGVRLAYDLGAGRSPAVVFLPGFASDMGGAKALRLAALCAELGQAMLRLDYSGHGASGGRFEDGSIGLWTADAEAVIRHAAPEGGLILVGSSMGGWIALNLAARLGARLAGMVLIAPAPDFTEDLMIPELTAEARAALDSTGVYRAPSIYGDPTPITRRLLEEGRNHLRLRGPIPLSCPVRILHGMRDPDVPWARSLRLAEKLTAEDVRLVLLKDGDHRLSREADLALLEETLAGLLGENRA